MIQPWIAARARGPLMCNIIIKSRSYLAGIICRNRIFNHHSSPRHQTLARFRRILCIRCITALSPARAFQSNHRWILQCCIRGEIVFSLIALSVCRYYLDRAERVSIVDRTNTESFHKHDSFLRRIRSIEPINSNCFYTFGDQEIKMERLPLFLRAQPG